MTQANYALRLQSSLKEAAEKVAKAEKISLNQFINVAVAEKLAALDTEAFFRDRGKEGVRKSFQAFLRDAGGGAPEDGDALP